MIKSPRTSKHVPKRSHAKTNREYVTLHIRSPWFGWGVAQLLVVGPISLIFITHYGGRTSLLYLGGVLAALFVQNGFTWAMRRLIRPELSTVADLLTQARGAVAAILAGLVVAQFHDRLSLIAWVSWGITLVGVTILDWLDGPLARYLGPTLLGRVLDIEFDSWLTLWCAAAAVTYGGLSWWCLLPPLAHYIHPIRALLHGILPVAGGPRWSRLTGVAQMVLLLSALLPLHAVWRTQALLTIAIPISSLQFIAQVALFFYFSL